MPDFVFRRATEADVPAIVRMLADDMLGSSRKHSGRKAFRDIWMPFALSMPTQTSFCWWSSTTGRRLSARFN